ncbi:Regulatory protein cys-3 [Paramyrothecium foliicola]|nr:Regulatory protein cys-3 [Paramyrothecium foliicola]
MTNYNGRRGPNVSQYLRDLNTISPHDTTGEDNFDMENGLSLFTNTEFFDFDSGQNTDFQAQPAKGDVETTHEPASETVTPAPSVMGNMHNIDFMPNGLNDELSRQMILSKTVANASTMAGDFNFPDFTAAYPAPSLNAYTDAPPAFPPLQPNHGPVYSSQLAPQQQSHYPQDAARVGEKRKADTVPVTPQDDNLEDASRQAAEEDKRRRNTAASARFRFKKKQREQALEKSAKEMSEKVSSLESKVSQLETENKWLKNLLVEKNEGNEDIVALWKEFAKQAGSKGKKTSAEPVKEER